MGRYEAALGKDSLKRRVSSNIKTFGFDADIDVLQGNIYKSRLKKLFRPKPEQNESIGIIFSDPNRVFVGSTVHYHLKDKYYFLCKSQKGHKESCCSTAEMYPRRIAKASFRVGCVILIYSEPELESNDYDYSIKPWVFGNSTYKQMNALAVSGPMTLLESDITLQRMSYMYDIVPLRSSVWQNSDSKEAIIAEAEPIHRELKYYLGQDLSTEEMGMLGWDR